MSNDLLIERLATDLKPVRRRHALMDGLILAGICLAELVAFLAMGGMRPDMPMAMGQPSFWWKLVGLGVIALAGGAVAILSLEPTASPRRGLRGLSALMLALLATGWLLDAGRNGWDELGTRLAWHYGLRCVAKMVLLSVPPAIALGVLMQRGAATDRTGTAWAAGLAAAAWGAFIFVFACPFDDPLYIAVWYTLGCGLVVLAVRLALPVLSRW